jgi:hypothetical protein
VESGANPYVFSYGQREVMGLAFDAGDLVRQVRAPTRIAVAKRRRHDWKRLPHRSKLCNELGINGLSEISAFAD